ncbi:MAG TPA: cupin domain-containing protein [Micromonosporaceae bacterium]|nr:cupin domain-containing protein [Micromonosporaceae bacterium]
MLLINENASRTTTTAAGVMSGLAAPSQGSTELSSWRVRMASGARGPVHAVDREQIWMPVAGTLVVTVDGKTERVGSGQAVILPAGVMRQISAPDEPAEALVCMPVGGRATLPGTDAAIPLPWAE